MELIGKTMLHYLLRGERNLSLAKAKIMAEKTGTDPLLWADPSRAVERRSAWEKAKQKKQKVKAK